MTKQCKYCVRYFRPDNRVGERQKACHRDDCKKKRKQQAQKNWCNKNPEYFKGDYWRVKEWRQKNKQSLFASSDKQDKILPSKPLQMLVLLIPADKTGMNKTR